MSRIDNEDLSVSLNGIKEDYCITHSLEREPRGTVIAETRVVVEVEIDGVLYSCNRVIRTRLKREPKS